MRLQKKSLSKINLTDLLRRKRSNLEKFLHETGIVTYDLLVSWCNSIGVVPPSEELFLKAMGNPSMHNLSSPTEGIVVLDAPSVKQEEEATSEKQDLEHTDEVSSEVVQQEQHQTRKKKKKTQNESHDDDVSTTQG